LAFLLDMLRTGNPTEVPMRKLIALMSCSLLAALVACGGEADPRIAEIEALTGDATAGETVFSANCASCHGADATGGTGPNLVEEADEEREEFIETIFNGKGVGMPSFKDELENQEIADVVSYLQSL